MPPLPGKMPSFTSGTPIRAVSSMMRISQARAISAPPPSAIPFNAAMTGIEPRKSRVLAGKFPGNDILAHTGEFADVGAGAERFGSRACHHHGAHPLVGRNVPAGGRKLVEGDQGGEVERRVVQRQHRNAAILQTVGDEGALAHDPILLLTLRGLEMGHVTSVRGRAQKADHQYRACARTPDGQDSENSAVTPPRSEMNARRLTRSPRRRARARCRRW